MELKNKVYTKSLKFNFELNKNIFNGSVFINKEDIHKSLTAIEMLCEYIRSCYFEDYEKKGSCNLEKYCRLLLRYEQCNQAIIVKKCKMTIKSILKNAINKPYSIKSIDLAISLGSSKNEVIHELCEELMNNSMGTHIRGSSI